MLWQQKEYQGICYLLLSRSRQTSDKGHWQGFEYQGPLLVTLYWQVLISDLTVSVLSSSILKSEGEEMNTHLHCDRGDLNSRMELKELVHVMQNCFWCSGEVSHYWEKRNLIPIFKKKKKKRRNNYSLASLTSVSRNITKQVLTETLSKYMKDRKSLETTNTDLSWANGTLLIWLHSVAKFWGSVNEERTVDVAYLYFGFYFDRFFHSKLVGELDKLWGSTTKKTKNWLGFLD